MLKIDRTVVIGVAAIVLCAARTDGGQGSHRRTPAVVADMKTTFTFADGREVAKTGRFYRSSEGRVREESPVAVMITDPVARTITLLNPEAKQAFVFHMPEGPLRSAKAQTMGLNNGDDGIHEGSRVAKSRAVDASGGSHEVWTDKGRGVVVFSRLQSGGTTTTKTLHNLSAQEPDPAVFLVPADYLVRKVKLAPDFQAMSVSEAAAARLRKK